MTPAECEKLARSEMNKWGLHNWSFAFNNKKTALGICSYRLRQIQVSNHHLSSKYEEIHDTILHEIAHALCFINDGERGHGYNWKKWCRKIGANPKRCGSSSGMTYKYSYYCRNCKKIVCRSHRALRRRYICRKCKCGLETHLTSEFDSSIRLSDKFSEISGLISSIGNVDIKLKLKRQLINILNLM